MPEARLAGLADLAFVRDATWAAYSSYLPILGAMPLPVSADHAAAIALGQVWLVRDGDADAGLIVLGQIERAVHFQHVRNRCAAAIMA